MRGLAVHPFLNYEFFFRGTVGGVVGGSVGVVPFSLSVSDA